MTEDTRFGYCAECGEPVIKSQRRVASKVGESYNPGIALLLCSADETHSINPKN